MQAQTRPNLDQELALHLPLLRRYARALAGSQAVGDGLAAATLERIIGNPGPVEAAQDRKTALFALFHEVWQAQDRPRYDEADGGLRRRAQSHLDQVTPNSREALLLHTVEGFARHDVARILGTTGPDVDGLLDQAYAEMTRAVTGRVMIIEDEPIIAMDLEAIVMEMGHHVTGVARTETEAIALADREAWDVLLSDIQLADDSSGIDAVNRILGADIHRPVIFITAFPERLLTGNGPEPAFLISKPFTEAQVRSAVSQAMFFASTETLHRDSGPEQGV